jgi:hemoglobin-like flavoprotein
MPVPPDPSLLVLDSDEEAFLKAATNIDEPEELRNHIQRIAMQAFEVGGLG